MYGHGEQFDELVEERAANRKYDPKEFEADCFASSLLMPKTALLKGLAARDWSPQELSAEQIYRLASWLGVGYRTLVGNMHWGMSLLRRDHAAALEKVKIPQIRQTILGLDHKQHLVVVDENWMGRAIDAQVYELILLPRDCVAEGGVVERICQKDAGCSSAQCDPASVERARLVPDGHSICVSVENSLLGWLGFAIWRKRKMSKLYVAQSHNLSLAWTEVFFQLMERGASNFAPAIITITDFDERSLPRQIPEIGKAIDTVNKQSYRTVASTIFPNSLWAPDAENDAQHLYARYERVWGTIAKCPANNKGVYFRRLTAYEPRTEGQPHQPVNQLAHILETYHRDNHRHSALQASIFDPTRDHSHNRQRGFPCLQQVAFNPTEGKLEVTGFYALQHHVPKAYGNYLGLCWLGRFMAKQMGLQLNQVTCVASSLKLPTHKVYSKEKLTPLKVNLERIVSQHDLRVA